jgi:hypothetical protein
MTDTDWEITIKLKVTTWTGFAASGTSTPEKFGGC